MPLAPIYYDEWKDVIRTSKELFTATPDQLEWRASDDMRSIHELVTHILDSSYLFLTRFIDPSQRKPSILEEGDLTFDNYLEQLQVLDTTVQQVFDNLNPADLDKIVMEQGDSKFTLHWAINRLVGHEMWHLAQLKMSQKLLKSQQIKAK